MLNLSLWPVGSVVAEQGLSCLEERGILAL